MVSSQEGFILKEWNIEYYDLAMHGQQTGLVPKDQDFLFVQMGETFFFLDAYLQNCFTDLYFLECFIIVWCLK